MKFRIKQLDDNIFIPQVKLGFFYSWESIDNNYNQTWMSDVYEEKWCRVKTYELAFSEIEIWKAKNTKKLPYPKYFKIL